MKEIKKERIKKIFITFGFVVLIFFVMTMLGYFIETKLFKDLRYSYHEYLLYLLGYGNLDNINIWFRVIFSICSLVALTYFSSACTVTWLESRRKLIIDNKIIITENGDGCFIAKLKVSSKKRDIYGAKISLIININGKSFSEITELAYIPKKHSSYAVFLVELNSVIYKYFNEFYNSSSDVSELVATVTYSDILSGTEYTIFEKFSCENQNSFVFGIEKNNENIFKENKVREEFIDFIGKSKFDIDFSNAQILDSKLPDRIPYSKNHYFDVNFNQNVDYEDGDFQMLYIPIPEVTEWGIYHDMKCNFCVKLLITEGTTVELQIKKNDGSILNFEGSNRLTKENSSLLINLSDYKRNTWENIKELCFTVFYKDVTKIDKCAKIKIEECSFVLKEEE